MGIDIFDGRSNPRRKKRLPAIRTDENGFDLVEFDLVVNAKQAHPCAYCRGTIERGGTYLRERWRTNREGQYIFRKKCSGCMNK
jgi:hypothetical protein